jgi:UDP-N-acetylmuramyl pentapeptide phosphotransferase/UDP-N-acetylglucosamine-1-phosphate transferase
VEALPFVTATFAAFMIAPAALRTLEAGPLARENYRGRKLACPMGVVIVAAAVLAMAPLAIAQQLATSTVLPPALGWVALYVLGVAVLGLADDVLADRARGWRGHAAAVAGGGFSSGALKAAGSAGLALYVMSQMGVGTARFVLGAAVLVLSTNAFNLLDLRPGRAIKVFVVLGVLLTLGSGELGSLWAVGLFAGPILVVGFYDLRELGLLGDTGSNLVGALAGAWLVLTMSDLGLAIAVVALAGMTAYGEFHSISELIERTPGLREIDSLGRPTDDSIA